MNLQAIKRSLRVSFSVLGVCVLFVSCEDYLENVSPDSALPLVGGLETPEALETFLLGGYSLLAGLDRFMVVSSDLFTEDIAPIDGACAAPLQFQRNDLSPNNFFVEGPWVSSYEIINQSNLVIAAVDRLLGLDDISQEDADRLSGEAHFLRAVMYFELVRLWAKPLHLDDNLGVPIVLQGVDNTDKITFPARDPVSAVYAQVKTDLTSAMQRLPVSKGVVGRASYYAAVAYQAELAFQTEEYETALLYARQIIDAGIYELVSSPEQFFRQKGTAEEIWSLVHTEQERGGLYSATISPNCNSTKLAPDLNERGFSKIVTSSQQAGLDANGWIADDLRFSTLSFFDANGTWRSSKYADPLGANNLPAMRYAEILLLYAECQARLGETEEAIAYLNKIRGRAIELRDGAGNVMPDDAILFDADDFTNTDELIEAIILERQIELNMEGYRFHDLIRLRRDVNGLPYNDNKLRWPIPQVELDANPNLVQNLGY